MCLLCDELAHSNLTESAYMLGMWKLHQGLDGTALLESVGGDKDFLRELIDLFLAACPTLLSAMRQSLAIDDFETMRRTARMLISSVHNLAVQSTHSAVEILERAITQAEPVDVAEAFGALERHMESLTDALSELNKLLELHNSLDT